MELNFTPDYFQGEEREGFFVEEDMKRAWAAQLVVLKDFDDVCKKHGLKWHIDYGTLLGAVRHKGYIPWDDDIDISMPRKDYDFFRTKAYKDLPGEHIVTSFHTDPENPDFLMRVVNHPSIDISKEVMDKYYGCPYCCGIDITPYDYIPNNEEDYKVYVDLVETLGGSADNIASGFLSYDEEKNLIRQIEKLLKVKFDRGRSIPNQLRIMCEKVCAMYTADDTDVAGFGIRQSGYNHFYYPVDELFDYVELPFEGVMLPAPKGYDRCLRMQYGEDYMTPRQIFTHDYPFYKEQREILKEQLRLQGEDLDSLKRDRI